MKRAKIINIQVADVIVTTRLRTTDEDKIRDLSESISSIGLLHPIAVAERDGKYVLLSGHYRLEHIRSFAAATSQRLFMRLTH